MSVVKTIISLSFIAALAAAQGLNCQSVWKNASASNDVVDCVTNTDRAMRNYSYLVPAGAVIVIFILFFLIFPILCLWCTCCKCCCECCKDVPVPKRDESKKSRCKVVITIIVVLAFGLTSLAVMLSGAPKVSSGANDVFVNLHKHILQYFENIVLNLMSIVRDPSTGSYTEPFTNSTFDSVRGYIYDIGNSTMKYRKDVTDYSDLATKVGYGVAIVPVFLVGFTVLFSLCNCRFCLPTCCSCIYYFFFFVFSIVALILFIIAPILGAIAAEIEPQDKKEPGVFQWYVIPYCEKEANFTSLKKELGDKEFEVSTKVCEEMSKYCSPAYNYDVSAPENVFYCNMTNATRATDCATFAMAVTVLNRTWTKVGATPCGASNCSFRQCANDCTVSDMRNTAAEAIKNVDMAERLFKALDYVKPLMDCNVLADRLLMMLKSMPEMRDGVWLLGAAFFIAQIMLIVAVVVMLLGAKLWFSEKEYKEGDCSSSDDDVPEQEMQNNEKEKGVVYVKNEPAV